MHRKEREMMKRRLSVLMVALTVAVMIGVAWADTPKKNVAAVPRAGERSPRGNAPRADEAR